MMKKSEYPRYFIPLQQHFVTYWKLLNKNGETIIVYKDERIQTNNWSLDMWRGWLDTGIIKEVNIEELALIV